MNPRERFLAVGALAVVILVGGGTVFKFVFLDPFWAVKSQIAAAEDELDKKQAELTKERLDHQTIVRRDPRLAHWQRLSLPDDKNQEQELKAGWALDEIKKRHEDKVQVDYEQYLTDLVMRSGFAPNSIKVSAAVADRKGGPVLTGKTPAYTRLSFTVQGQASLDAVVQMLQGFYRTPLLHEVRNLTLTNRPPQNRPAPTGGPLAPGMGPVGPPGPPRGRTFGGTTADGGDLDVNMTVEALLVTGAEKREALLPDGAAIPAQLLPEPSRQYTDMLAKNMFTGIPAVSKLTEDRREVLAAVKLTAIWNGGRRWEATIYDQGKGGDEKRVTERLLTDFTIADKYNNTLVDGKVVRLGENGMIFEADKKYYRWLLGDFLGTAMESPLKTDELKELGLDAYGERGASAP